MSHDFNEHGYLGDAIRDFQKAVLQKHEKFFELLRQLNLYSQTKKFDLQIDSENGQQVLAVSLFTKNLNDVQAIYILCTYGLTQQSRIVLRSTVEGFFLLAKIVADPSFVATYIKADIINRLNIMKASHNYSVPLFADLRKLASENAIRELEKQKKEENIRPIKIEAIAKSVGLGAYYDSVYRLLSQDVHSQVRSLEDYVATGSEGDIGNIEWGPREEDVPTCLATAADVLIRSWMAIDQLFKQEIQSKMQEFMKDLGTIQKESSKCANGHFETGNE